LLTGANMLLVSGLAVLIVLLLVGLAVSLIAPSDPLTMNVLDALKPPSADHLLGTDRFGRDVYSRILWGTRGSLLVSFASVAVAVLIGSGLDNHDGLELAARLKMERPSLLVALLAGELDTESLLTASALGIQIADRADMPVVAELLASLAAV